MNTDSEYKRALRYHQSGELQKAEEIYQKILHTSPNHSDSLHLLGVIANQVGKFDVAVNLINKAIQHNPKVPVYYNNLGNALKDQGKFAEAVPYYQKAVKLKPDYAKAYFNLGNALKGQGALVEAISSYKKSLDSKPDYPDVYNNMGNTFKEQGKLDEAVSSFCKALKLKPDFAEAYYNLGAAFKEQGKLEEAISYFKKALEFKPDFAEAYNNIGTTLKEQGMLAEAISYYQKALELKPRLAEVHNNIGAALKDQGKLEEAIPYFQKAMEFKPDYAEAHYNYGSILKDQGKISEAVSFFEKALKFKPDYAAAYCELFHQLQQTCAWQKLEDMAAGLDEFTTMALDNGAKAPETPFVGFTRNTDQSRNLAIARSWSHDLGKVMSSLEIQFPFENRRPGKTDKITVGYLSNDFQNHAMSHLTLSMYGLHDRDGFNIFCYSYGEDDGSSHRARIRQECDRFVDIRGLSHADAARCIYEDEVDILVDLKGHTRGSRLEISSLRPAPVQVRYLGPPCTTGADFIDYIITDRIAMPEDQCQYYSEKFVYMPDCYQVNDHTQAISNKEWKKPDFGLPEDGFVFCSFNQGYKIGPVIFDTWMNILRQVTDSVLWLQRGGEITERNLRQEAEGRGVDPTRLIFADKLLKDQHLGRLRLVDIALDTRTVNGIITTSDALWAGVPVVTLQGSSFASRVSSSILTAIGLPELITNTLEEYESLAIDMARNQDKLQTIRQEIANNRLTGPLFDTPRFTRNLENAYKEMWEIFVSGESPRQIEVMET